MWEDEKNRHGGRWLINLDKKQRMTSLDNFWLEVMLCLIGESFEDHSQVVSAISNSIHREGRVDLDTFLTDFTPTLLLD